MATVIAIVPVDKLNCPEHIAAVVVHVAMNPMESIGLAGHGYVGVIGVVGRCQAEGMSYLVKHRVLDECRAIACRLVVDPPNADGRAWSIHLETTSRFILEQTDLKVDTAGQIDAEAVETITLDDELEPVGGLVPPQLETRARRGHIVPRPAHIPNPGALQPVARGIVLAVVEQ